MYNWEDPIIYSRTTVLCIKYTEWGREIYTISLSWILHVQLGRAQSNGFSGATDEMAIPN